MSVWDMAGQLEYHSFHDSMLPDLGDLAIPSLFLFVWNPFETKVEGQLLRAQGGGLVLKRPEDFRGDFQYWLKFLASKTPKSNVLKPKVMVVVTRADLGLPNMKVELQADFDSLRVEFEDYIHLDTEGFFQVDAMDPKTVSRLGSHLLNCTKAILEEAINDFSICDEARDLFADWNLKGEIPPLITKERFFCLTQDNLGIHKEMCEAVAHSLNTSGDVIFFSALKLVDIKVIKADIKRLSQQVEDLRDAVLPRLCELFTFVKEGEAGKLPRMFVVTEDDGRVRRVVCRMVLGLHKLRLELLCECRYEQAHLVDGQHGLSITTLDDGLLKRGLPYIHGFLKVAYAATKIGAHVAAGCGDMIPDFTTVMAKLMLDALEFGALQSFSDFTSSRIDPRSSQQWVFHVLSHSNCIRGEQIHAQFGVRRIRLAVTNTTHKVNLRQREIDSDSADSLETIADGTFSSREAAWCIISLLM
ncbi:hypothetical protein L7F22_014374 [Adiantum nelumboides]|nr:hypothetical protein [Adiantum nelumboides]